MSWWRPRTREALADSLAASGAGGSAGALDPVDSERGWRRLGAGRREVPSWTLEKARTLSVHAYRVNPMARAIIDTYTSFCVGDSGIRPTSPDPRVRGVIDRLWSDPRNRLDSNASQELLLRSHMLMGETALELLVAPNGATRISYVDPSLIEAVELEAGNLWWSSQLRLTLRDPQGEPIRLPIARFDDLSGLVDGRVVWWPEWRAWAGDTRGYPFLAPVLDWLDAYDQTVWNLIDRTAIARYMVFDVTVNGGQADIDKWINARGGTHAPRSGSMEVHNEHVRIEPKTAQTGAFEDKQTAQQAMTNIAAGAGLAKTWLAEPEDANRATSLTMAEPVRRRVRGVQGLWVAHMTELLRFGVDRHIAAGRLPRQTTITTAGGEQVRVPSSQVVTVTAPEIAATDAKVNATILMTLSQAFAKLPSDLLSPEARSLALQKAWEDYVGVPFDPALQRRADRGDDPDLLAERIGNEDPSPDAQSLRLISA